MVKKLLQDSADPSSTEVLVAAPVLNTINDLLVSDDFKTPYQRFSSYSSNSHKWSKRETEYFYELLGRFGTDFSIMAANYPNGVTNSPRKRKSRTKKQLLNKYKKQERQNRQRIAEVFEASWKLKTFGQLVKQQVLVENSKPAKKIVKQCQQKNIVCTDKLDLPLIKNYSTSVSQNQEFEDFFQEEEVKKWCNQQNQYLCQV